MTISSEATRFSSADETLVGQGPRLHTGAIVALVLGVLSLAAPWTAALWILPVIAAFIAVLALASIARQKDSYRGRAFAATGLGLALFSLAWALTQHVYLETLMQDRSRELARQWLDLVLMDRMQQAHHLTLNRNSRAAPDESLSSFYENPDQEKSLKQLKGKSEIASLRDGGQESQVEHRGSSIAQIGKNYEQFAHDFRVRTARDNKLVDIRIVVERDLHPQHGVCWRILSTSGSARAVE